MAQESVLCTVQGELPATVVNNGETAHDAAMRGIKQQMEINPEWIRIRAVRMPRVCESDGLTLFVYDLVLPPAEARTKWWGRAARWVRLRDAKGQAAATLARVAAVEPSK